MSILNMVYNKLTSYTSKNIHHLLDLFQKQHKNKCQFKHQTKHTKTVMNIFKIYK